MKRTIELDEDDIKEAINFWLNSKYKDDTSFGIDFFILYNTHDKIVSARAEELNKY